MVTHDQEGTRGWGDKAIALAERLGETEVLVHTLVTVGTAEGRDGSTETLERALGLALADDLQEHAGRAYNNLVASEADRRQLDEAERWLREGLAYCADRDLDAWSRCMLGMEAEIELWRARLDAASDLASLVLADPNVAPVQRISALMVRGLVRARRGEPEAWPPLDEALAYAASSGEVQQLGPVALARAEARWLAGDDAGAAAEARRVLPLAVDRRAPWAAGELAVWLQRAGEATPAPPMAPPPCAAELAGNAVGAARLRREMGLPYEAALALAQGGGADAVAALTELRSLGATAAAEAVAARLRRRGVRGVPRGPRAATQRNAAGLTPRELEVLALVAEGASNRVIAERLVISETTAARHVANIFRKLGVGTRAQAVRVAAEIGVLAPA